MATETQVRGCQALGMEGVVSQGQPEGVLGVIEPLCMLIVAVITQIYTSLETHTHTHLILLYAH